jgi:hypothetical protein
MLRKQRRRGMRLAWLGVAYGLILTGCGQTIQIPTSQLEAAVICPTGMTCSTDPSRVVIQRGALEQIANLLNECAKHP